MKRNGYELPVLIDNGYWKAAGVRGAPTTWFLDKEGVKAFEVAGMTGSPPEEFAARIDALRN